MVIVSRGAGMRGVTETVCCGPCPGRVCRTCATGCARRAEVRSPAPADHAEHVCDGWSLLPKQVSDSPGCSLVADEFAGVVESVRW
jgi:hypothetical protein